MFVQHLLNFRPFSIPFVCSYAWNSFIFKILDLISEEFYLHAGFQTTANCMGEAATWPAKW